MSTVTGDGPPKNKVANNVFVTLATFAIGAGLAVQSQLNGTLTDRTGSAVLVTLLSFAIGTAILLTLVLIRRQLPTRAELSRWQWRRWWLLSGPLGAFVVVAIASGVPLLGVSLAIVLTVAGQTVTGIIVDSRGTGMGDRIRITGSRAAAVGVAVAGLGVTVFAVPATQSTGGVPVPVAVMVMLLIAAGVAAALQQAANGAVTGVSGNPAFAALVSFGGGFTVLALAAVILWFFGSTVSALPSFADEWWLYTGGILGTIFVVTAAWAVRKIGVLVLSLAIVAGQTVTAVTLDLATGAATVGLATVVSIVAVLVAVVLAVLPSRSARSEPSGTLEKENHARS